MVINIGTLTDDGRMSLSFSESFSVSPEYGVLTDSVMLAIEAMLCNNGGVFTFIGRGEACLSTVCAKCLEPVEGHCCFDINERYVRELPSDDDDIWLFNGDEIDLSPALRSGLLLNIPVKFLCSHACKGLCPVCGKNMNTENCSCNTDVTNSRFDVLRTFFDIK